MEGVFHRWATLLWILALVCGCRHTSEDSGGLSDKVARAQALLAAEPAPDRREVVALAHELVAEAEMRSGAEAARRRELGARLWERSWRRYGGQDDAEAALGALERAARDVSAEGTKRRCDLLIAHARLKGELVGDVASAVQALTAVSRDLPDAGAPSNECRAEIEQLLGAIGQFRPIAPPSAAPTNRPRVLGVETWPGSEAARVVISVDRPVPYAVSDGQEGEQRYSQIEIQGATMGRLPPQFAVGGVVSHVAVLSSAGNLRIRAYLPAPGFRRAFHLPEPYRIVLDVARQLPGKYPPRSVTRVAIDAGHGGADPGAIGPSGLREKDVTLDVVHRLAPILAKAGIAVVLTRDEDRTVSLEERTARVNASQADLFVSIHCNAAEKSESHGVETYVLDTEKDLVASRVAARENATSEAAAREIGTILASLKLQDQRPHAVHFAELVQKAVTTSLRLKFGHVRDGGVKQAGFYVLVGARMPSILFEASYISNADEERELGQEEYRQRLADGIANAIRAYREGR